MFRQIIYTCCVIILVSNACYSQVLQFGTCVEVETMEYFDIVRFLGLWYEVARFPTWYENHGACAFKTIEYCGRRIKIEHAFVRDDIQFVLHVNSSYYPGDSAVFTIQENNIDPVGIPLTVISTDYSNYALVYGCKSIDELDIKYITAWVLSREPDLAEDIYQRVVNELNSVSSANMAFLEKVEQRPEKCNYYWTAHVQASNIENTNTEE